MAYFDLGAFGDLSGACPGQLPGESLWACLNRVRDERVAAGSSCPGRLPGETLWACLARFRDATAAARLAEHEAALREEGEEVQAALAAELVERERLAAALEAEARRLEEARKSRWKTAIWAVPVGVVLLGVAAWAIGGIRRDRRLSRGAA